VTSLSPWLLGASGRPSLWQKSYDDNVFRRDEDVRDVVRYILADPVRAGLAPSPSSYPYSWSRFGKAGPG